MSDVQMDTSMSSEPRDTAAQDIPRKTAYGRPALNWGWMMAAGVTYTIGGAIALLNPFLASLVAQSLIAAAFLIGGSVGLWMAVKNEDGTSGGRVVSAIGAGLAIVLAIVLWANPIGGLLSLTLTVASFLVAIGAVRAWVGWRMRERQGWGWFVASGVLTVALGVYIFATLPSSALTILGLFLAVELLFAGAAQIAAALAARREKQAAMETGAPEWPAEGR